MARKRKSRAAALDLKQLGAYDLPTERRMAKGGASVEVLAEAGGAPRKVLRMRDRVAELLRGQRITPTQAEAARWFASLVELANVADIQALDWRRIRVDGGNPVPSGPAGGDGGLARVELWGALTACGGAHSAVGSVALNVIGLGQSIEQWCLMARDRPYGPISQQGASGLLVGACAVLAVYRSTAPGRVQTD